MTRATGTRWTIRTGDVPAFSLHLCDAHVDQVNALPGGALVQVDTRRTQTSCSLCPGRLTRADDGARYAAE